MRKIYYTLLLVLTAPLFINAQEIVVTPQIGIQSSGTKTTFNNSPFYRPADNSTASIGLRLAYQSKKGHGPFVGVALASTTTNYSVVDASGNYLGYQIGGRNVVRTQLGYQWNTKRLYFKRLWDNSLSREEFDKLAKKGWYVRFQPYAGVGMDFGIDNSSHGFMPNTSGYVYSPIYKHTAHFTAGLNLEFGRNDKKKFTLGIGYMRQIGDPHYTQLTQTVNGNTYTSYWHNRTSTFNVTLGVPLTIWKKRR
jgi:hypothetical protein